MADGRDKELMDMMGGGGRRPGARNDDNTLPGGQTSSTPFTRDGSTYSAPGAHGVSDFHTLRKAAQTNRGGVDVIVDGQNRLFFGEDARGNPGLTRIVGEAPGGGFFVDANEFRAAHPKSADWVKKFGPAIVGGIAGAGLLAGPSLAAGGAAPAAAAPTSLAGPLAAPEGVSSFLGGVPSAVPGTQLPIGGSLIDITGAGAVDAAAGAGNLITPGGAPSGLPGASGEPGAPAAPTGEAPAIPGVEGGGVTPPATPAGGAGGLNQAPVVDIAPPQPVTSATTPAISGSPVGSGGVQAGAPVSEIGRPASLVDQARIGGGNLLNRAITTAAKNPLAVGGLGLNLFAQSNAKKEGKRLDDQLRAAGADADRIAKSLTTQGLSGQPSASSAHEINQWEQNQIGAIKQRYANMGRDPNNDSAAAKELGDVTSKAVAMRDAAARGLLTQGLQASQIAQGPATNAALAAAQRDRDFAASMGSVLQALAQIQAMENRSAPAAPGTP